ncbi:ATP-binding protein [Actinomadura formosensis]|uniref:ATP-binding protein n=1 Tax=Actinomadura formosensis TaxID=60706 RepID=UPI0008363A46|nr:ATP-binding protein [Actinomadura formosensis]
MIAFEKNTGNHAVKAARDHVAAIAGKWPIDLDDVLVVTSELVTNALRHASTDVIQVGAWAIEKDGRGLYSVEVWDRDDQSRPELHEPPPGPDAEAGRGLWLVQGLSGNWGVLDGVSGGKLVYAEWTR